MYDLHTHSIFSDGVLIPMELAVRYESKGYKVIGITDHVDYSNIDLVIPNIMKVCEKINKSDLKIKVIPGVEISYVPINKIADFVEYVRESGIQLVIGHGETIVEPVPEGSNKAYIDSGVDILAHPGLIKENLVEISAGKGVFLELTARKGHSLTNGHVTFLAKQKKAKLIINTDFHAPGDILSFEQLKQIGLGSGLSLEEVNEIYNNEKKFIKNLI